MEQSRLEQLLGFLNQAPNDPFTLYSVAFEYAQMEKSVEAAQYFEKLLAIAPDYVGAYYHYGRVLEQLGNPESAIGVYNAGILVAQKKKDQHAREELERALANLQGKEESSDPYWDEV